MIHIEKLQSTENLVGGFTVDLQVLLWGEILPDDRTNDGSGSQQDKSDYGQLEGAEKVPDGSNSITVICAQDCVS
jgi:hypothetical protein